MSSHLQTASRLLLASGLTLVAGAAVLQAGAAASDPQIEAALAAAKTFAVLGGQTATNTGPSTLNGDLGVSPGTAAPGFDVATVNGTTHLGPNSLAADAQTGATAAYGIADGRTGTALGSPELGGRTLVGGVYTNPTLGLTGSLTLDGGGRSDSVWIFQADSTLTTAVGSSVVLTNGADACSVYWQIGSSATLGASSDFVGTVLAQVSISVDDDVDVLGRLLARSGAVTLINDRITVPACSSATTTTTGAPGGSTTTTGGSGGSTTTTGGSGGTTSTTSVPATTTTTTGVGVTTTTAAATPTTLAATPTTSAAIPSTTRTTLLARLENRPPLGGARVAAAGGSSGGTTRRATGTLPATGSSTAPLVALGLGALFAGLLLTAAGRPGRYVAQHRR